MKSFIYSFFAIAALSLAGNDLFAQPGYLYTVAGTTSSGYSGDGGSALSAHFNYVGGVARDAAGNLYVADASNNVIRKIAAGTGIITHIAGIKDSTSFAGDGGSATSAHLYQPVHLVLDGAGGLYINDRFHGRIRKIDLSSGIITTIAGNDTGSYTANGVPATAARLANASAMCRDAAGNLYVGSVAGIRKITPSGQVYTVAGLVTTAGYAGDGGPATDAKMMAPGGVAVDASGNIYIADRFNQRIRKVDASTGIITTIAGTGTSGFSGDGGAATAANLWNPMALAFDLSGNLLVSDYDNNRIRKIDRITGVITTVAGTGVSADTCYKGEGTRSDTSCIAGNFQMEIDPAGIKYFGNGNRLSKITPTPLDVKITLSSSGTVTLYPNPAGDELTISMPKGAFNTYIVTNSIGREMMSIPITDIETKINTRILPNGIYHIRLMGRDGVVVKQFVKM